MFDSQIKIYLARKMTGLVKEDIVKQATTDREFFEKSGLVCLDPVKEEGVKSTKEKLLSSKEKMTEYWPRDKALIRESHVIVDMTPHLNSEGTKHELGYGRYCLWKPVVRVFPTGQLPPKSSVAFFEDDAVVDSNIEALEYILRVHGNWLKRLKWRVILINRCLPRWMWYQLLEFFR